jgi:hypothetical protein
MASFAELQVEAAHMGAEAARLGTAAARLGIEAARAKDAASLLSLAGICAQMQEIYWRATAALWIAETAHSGAEEIRAEAYSACQGASVARSEEEAAQVLAGLAEMIAEVRSILRDCK